MNEVELYCEDPFGIGCRWSGDPEELVDTEEEPDSFSHCPNCEGTRFHEEEIE